MNLLPPTVADALGAQGWKVQGASAVSGGMINRVARVETSDGPLLVKWNPDATPGLFTMEAAGLAALRATGTVRVPQVILCSDAPSFLALEFLPVAKPHDNATVARRLGEELARLHQATADAKPLCGFDDDNFVGTLPQVNGPRTALWPAFYRDARLLPQIARASAAGLAPPRTRLLLDVVERLDELLADLPPDVSLLHGDLWAGNLLCLTGDQPAIIDPAVYHGPREMEIAFTELWGGFPRGWLDCYRGAWALPPDYEARRPLHQLYPLLVHLNLFGEQYGPAVERACRDALR